MATVVLLSEEQGRGSGGNAGGVVRDRLKSERKAESDASRAKSLSTLFLELNNENGVDKKAVAKTIESGAITKSSDLISLISQMRLNRDSNTIKVDAFNNQGNKVPFAVSKNDLATGRGEANANRLGLTLTNKGKQRDFFEDAPNQKFVGSSSGRIEGKITLNEWKSKYGSSKSKETEKATTVRDYLTKEKIEITPESKTNAKEFLFKRQKAFDAITERFGKKVGDNWEILDPLKNQMASIAKLQVEGFIMKEGLTAEQAGVQAGMLAERLLTKNKSDIIDQSGKLIPDKIEIPDTITSPKDRVSYIQRTYGLSREDAIQFILDNEAEE